MSDDIKVVMWALDGWKIFERPVKVLSASNHEEIGLILSEVQDAVDKGLFAVGFLSYEAASGLDKACVANSLDALPLAWFGLFEGGKDFPLQAIDGESFNLGSWEPLISSDEYKDDIGKIKKYLKDGDTYQVNYTFRMRTSFEGDPLAFFSQLCRSQRSKYCAFIDTDDFAICSASPELFFSLKGNDIVSRPMKGTSKRGLTLEQDKKFMDALRASDKNRAENVMIVDMVRNDLGRIADAGSVNVPVIFDIEKYPTLFQMTSTVASKTSASLPEIMKALFPCASITGAPKIRTMEIIRELEREPRGVYTGCIGYVFPERDAQFNVAIRTVMIDKRHSTAEYGVGGGIVWDSDAESEYAECLVKAAVLTSETPDFELLETMLWDGSEYFLLDNHLKRLKESIEYFGFDSDIDEIKNLFIENKDKIQDAKVMVRLLISDDGSVKIENKQLADEPVSVLNVSLAKEPVNSKNPFLYHKTTNRKVYSDAKRAVTGVDDVLLYNENGEITESTIANVVIDKAGKRITPPVKCGLLAGTFREKLLETGEVEEGIITIDELRNADEVFLVNSVRKWMKCKVV